VSNKGIFQDQGSWQGSSDPRGREWEFKEGERERAGYIRGRPGEQGQCQECTQSKP
jgi:hypothetical protein